MITKKTGTKQMTELKATPIVKNKFWIVEKNGQKVATIQNTDDGVVWVDSLHREKYPTIKMLTHKHNVEFVKPVVKKKTAQPQEVNGFPAEGKIFNALYDVSKHLPIYTKEDKSKSFFCAGYYLVRLNNSWTRAFCPKLITLQRYEFLGPFATEQAQTDALRSQHGK
jgi:hypothetical protein